MSKYTKQVLQEAANASNSYAGMLRYLKVKQSGGMHSHIRKMSTKLGVDTSHFTGKNWSKGCSPSNRLTAEQILCYDIYSLERTKTHQLRRALIEIGRRYACEGVGCAVGEFWLAKEITLHIDHIDGNPLNNRAENLRFLCPNCHSQTPTFSNKKRITAR